MQAVFLVCAFISIAAVIMICYFVFVNGFPAFHKIGPANFLFGRTWNPDADQYGIFPLIIASLCHCRCHHYRCPHWNIHRRLSLLLCQ